LIWEISMESRQILKRKPRRQKPRRPMKCRYRKPSRIWSLLVKTTSYEKQQQL
jgi:hypothetical protein